MCLSEKQSKGTLKLESLEQNITPIFEIKDDRFEIGQIASCYLLIEISKDRFRFAIYHTQNELFMWLEDYQIITLMDENQLLQTLKRIYDQHHFLAANYWKSIYLSVNSDYFTLIPDELYQNDEAAKYLNFASGSSTTDTHAVYDYHHAKLEAFNVFGVDKKIVSWFKDMYPVKKITPVHLTSTLIEGIYRENKSAGGLHLHFEEGSFIALYFEKNKLQFCNRFNYRTAPDLVYHVLFVMNQLGLKSSTPVTFYGEVTMFSEGYTLLTSTLQNIKFAELPSGFKFSYFFEEIPEHRYYGLFSTLYTF